MTAATSAAIDNLFSLVEPLLGHSSEEASVHGLLGSLGKLPIPDLDPEDRWLYVSDEEEGYCLLFQTAETLEHASAQGKPASALVLIGCFFYAEGVEDYRAFRGVLPHGLTWSDTSASLGQKLGAAKNEIRGKKTGVLTSQRWLLQGLLMTVSYGDRGNVSEVYVGIV